MRWAFRAARLAGLCGVAAMAASSAAQAQRTERRSMSFEACIATIQRAASDLRTAPINIVETPSLRIVRFPTAGGSVLVTCSRADNMMLMEERGRP